MSSSASASDPLVCPPVALITGAARGIGAATARRLAADGWNLILTDICGPIPELRYQLSSLQDLEDTAQACRDLADGEDSVLTAVADVRDQTQLDDAVRLAVDAFGGLDAAVAAAGIVAGGDPGWGIPDEMWEVNIGVNLTGVWRTAKACIPAMLRQPKPRRGRFVAISSAAGMRGNPTIADYTAAKHGVIGLVRSLAKELGPRGITANAVAPGSTQTDILNASAALYGLSSNEEFSIHHSVPRLLDPAEIADAIAWLVDERRSGVTGIVLPVDAGMTI
jgi:SDR family mycofactocin-dependent oxidoreductase